MYTNKDKKKIFYYIGIFLYFIAFAGVILSPALTYLTYQKLAREGFIFSLFLSIIGAIFLLLGKIYVSQNIRQQMLSMYIIVALIFFPMFIRNIRYGYNTYYIFQWIELIVITVGLVFWSVMLLVTKPKPNFCREQGTLLFLVTVTILLSIEQLGIVLKGDSVVYYSKIIRICQNFTFNPNDISLFKNSGHGCYSFSLFSTIGENIIPFYGLGVRIENIVIWIICIIFLYKILNQIFPTMSKTVMWGCIYCFAFTPLILSNIQEISVEIYVLLFFILFFYFNITQKHILEMFFAICFVFAKEPCVLILACYYLGFFIQHIVNCLKSSSSRFNFFDRHFILSSISIYMAAISFSLYFVIDTTWGRNVVFDDKNAVLGNTFGINLVLIASKLKQLFILNFAWLPTLCIIIAVFFSILKKQRKKIKTFPLLPIIFSYIGFLAGQLLYLTFVVPRYILLQYFYIVIIFAFLFQNIKLNIVLARIIMCTSISITLIQNFYNIDFISCKFFDELNTGNGSMIFDNPLYIDDRGALITNKDNEIPYIQPYGMTNRQFSYFDKLLEIAFSKINYSAGDLVVLPRSFDLYPDNFYWGNALNTYYYNRETKHFIQLTNEIVPPPENIIKLNVTQTSKEHKLKEIEGYKNIYYFDFCFSDNIDEYIKKEYKIKKTETLNYRGWSLDIHQLEIENDKKKK